MTKKELINRWNNKEGKQRLAEIINCFTKGKTLSSVIGLEKHGERWDLRGATLSVITKEQKIEAGGHSLTIKTGSLKVSNLVIEYIDFSYADISYSVWHRCTFKKCLFQQVNAKETKFVACDIEDCIFLKSDFSYAYLNENIGSNSGSFFKTYFKETNLSESVFCFPVINECVFEDCKLMATNFDGSRLSNSIFLGEVNSPWFRGYSTTGHKAILGIFNRVNLKSYPNEMKNIDFSKAKLVGVSFCNHINLQSCKFPKTDQYIFINKLSETMIAARKVIDSDWADEYKRMGLFLIDTVYFNKDKHDQSSDFIDTYPIASSNMQFEQAFFALIRQCNSN